MAAGQSGAHRGNAEKDSGLVNAVQAALNGAIASGDYAKALNRWGEGVESIPQSEIDPPDWATDRRRDERSIPRYFSGGSGAAADY